MIRLVPPAVAALLLVSTMQNADNPPSREPGAPTTLRTGTKLVVVDVVVTGKNHQPVHGLMASDFTLLEDNQAQVLKSFEEHTAPTPEQLQAIGPRPKLPEGVFTNYTPVPAAMANGPINVLLIDRLNTPIVNQNNLRNQVLDYLKKQKIGQRVAIFALTQQLSMLQGFTDDPEVLRATVEKYRAKASPLLENALDGSIPQLPMDQLPGPSGQRMQAQIEAEQKAQRAVRTLEAMNSLARYLSGIPGRKNLVWFSGSFPLNLLPDSDPALAAQTASFMNVSDAQEEFKATVDLLSRAQVAVYPVDARGVVLLKGFSTANGGPAAYKRPGASGPGGDLDKETASLFDEHNTMREMAYATGGRAFVEDNDLAGAMNDAIADGSSYYTMTYAPADGDWKGDFRKIQVLFRLKDYDLEYRRGYYADDPDHPTSNWNKLAEGRSIAQAWATDMRAPTAMYAAMVHGGPMPAQIVFTVQAAEVGAGGEEKLAADNVGTPLAKGPYRRYELTYAANPRSLRFQDAADGLRHATVEYMTFVYTSNGDRVDAVENIVHLNLTVAQYAEAVKNSMVFHQQVSVPVKGEFSLRAAVHDLNNDRVGAVEIPVSAVKNLAAK